MAVLVEPSQFLAGSPNARSTVFIRPLVSVEKIQLQIKAQDTEATRWGTKKAVWAKLLILRSFCSHTAKITDRAISRNMWMKV